MRQWIWEGSLPASASAPSIVRGALGGGRRLLPSSRDGYSNASSQLAPAISVAPARNGNAGVIGIVLGAGYQRMEQRMGREATPVMKVE
jgi:hypothetical protein